ncbi:nicotinate (nicotinamide) nucleotide adenylyltransferase [Massilia sp. W12]|uniref:nicotinate (nicotinamide) nucleotide adenylyltransferase n=1 Tax=Massilia sp. W12 TaxID=3126507 RepID=UPI0030CE328A
MRPCIAILGGSFDPAHLGHVALGRHVHSALQADELRLLPVGCPWQKGGLQASCEQRLAMLQLAFAETGLPLYFDQRELHQQSPNYTVQTLQQMRAELGPQVAMVFVIGADQWQRLHTWREWPRLFELAHLAVAMRPGFTIQGEAQAQARLADLAQLRTQPFGSAVQLPPMAHPASATRVRELLQNQGAHLAPAVQEELAQLLPAKVLDYIQYHQLYRHGN